MRKLLFSAVLVLSAAAVSCTGAKKSEAKEEQRVETTDTVVAPAAANNSTAPDAPIHLTTAEFKKLVVDYEANPTEWKYLGDKPAIIDFWADWCPPCKAIAPVLDDLAKEYQGQIYIYKVDVDEETRLASAFGIQSIPTLLFVPMTGNPKAELGAIPKEAFKERIDNFLLTQK